VKLGIVVNNLGPSQMNFDIIRQTNGFLSASALADVIVFYENLQRPCLPMSFACMQVAEAWGFDGALIATNLSTAEKVLRCPSSRKRLFYLWDLEWLRLQQKHYRSLQATYAHPDLTLITRNEDHKKVVENAWNVRVAATIDDFDIASLMKIAQKD
jgi:hypothetical protein